MGKLKDIDSVSMFAAGALSAVEGTGMNEGEAREFVSQVCKEAASKRRRFDPEDDDEEESTLWDDWKGILIPAGLGLTGWLLGYGAHRFGKPGVGIFENTGNLIWDRVKRLVGYNDSELMNSFTKADPNRSKREWQEIMEMDRKGSNGPGFMKVPGVVNSSVPRKPYPENLNAGSLYLGKTDGGGEPADPQDNQGKSDSGGQ